MSAHRYTVNRSPSDGHLPADWATAKRGWAHFWRSLGLAALVAVLGIAVTLAAVGAGL